MNLSATKQQSANANRQLAVRGDQDISAFAIDESAQIDQSMRCSLQVSQQIQKLSAAAKQNINKLLFQNKQMHRLETSKIDFKSHQPASAGIGNLKQSGFITSPLDYKSKHTPFENKGILTSVDLTAAFHKNRELSEDENLIKLVSEHLVQSIQYLQKRQHLHQSVAYLETEGEDVPDENIAIHTIKSEIKGPNLLSQKNETTDMEKVKYQEQNFTQIWFQQQQQLQHNNLRRTNQQIQHEQQSINGINQLGRDNANDDASTDSDTDQETPHLRQPVIYKRGSGSDTPILARNMGKKHTSNMEESKVSSQQVTNSFSEDYSSDSLEENENSSEIKQSQQISQSNLHIELQKGKGFDVLLREKQLKEEIEIMKKHMHANGLINSIDLKKDQRNSHSIDVTQFNRSPKKFLTTSNVPITLNKQDSDSKASTYLRNSKKLNTTQGFKPSLVNANSIITGMSNHKSNSEFSPPFDLLHPGEVGAGNSLLIPPQEHPFLSGSTMDETYDLQQQLQQMKQLNPFEDNRMNQKFSTLMQNSILTSQKKKSILSTQSHNINQFSGKKNESIQHGVRFDQNVEFFDSNLDLLKKHQDQSMNQSLLPELKNSTLPQPPNLRSLSQLPNNKQKYNSSLNTTNLTPSIIEQRSSEIKNQQIIQEGWLLKKSTNKVLNTYQKRYFILTSEKLFYSKDPTFKKIKGCINIKYLTCFVSLNKNRPNPKKLHLKITEMKKLLKLKEIIPGDIVRWQRNLQQVISYYYNQEKVMMSNGQNKNNYKRDVITESDLEQIAETGDFIMFNNDHEKSKNSSAVSQHLEMGMLIKFNNNDLRVFYIDKQETIQLSRWERFILENDIYNSLIFRNLQMAERNSILPYIYESVRQHLNDNYKKKLKNTLSDNQEDSKQLPSIQKNSQLIASIFQKANLIKPQKNISKFTTESFCEKKGIKLLNNAKLSNEITVVLKRHIFFASENSDIE